METIHKQDWDSEKRSDEGISEDTPYIVDHEAEKRFVSN